MPNKNGELHHLALSLPPASMGRSYAQSLGLGLALTATSLTATFLYSSKRSTNLLSTSHRPREITIFPPPPPSLSPHTLIFLSSHYQNSQFWRRTASILSSRGYSCHLIHLELGDTSKSLLTLREYIESIDSKNGTSRVIMFGHSLGGTIAQLYAMNDYPVSGMVLLASCGVEVRFRVCAINIVSDGSELRLLHCKCLTRIRVRSSLR